MYRTIFANINPKKLSDNSEVFDVVLQQDDHSITLPAVTERDALAFVDMFTTIVTACTNAEIEDTLISLYHRQQNS